MDRMVWRLVDSIAGEMTATEREDDSEGGAVRPILRFLGGWTGEWEASALLSVAT